MARSSSYWYNLIITEKDTQPLIQAELQPDGDELQNLRLIIQEDDSPSQPVYWRIWSWIVAAAMWFMDTLFDQHKSETTFLVRKRGQVGQYWWWVDKSLEFQYGHTVKVLEDEYGLKYTGYDPIDEDAKCVKLVALVSGTTKDYLKVANVDNAGVPVKLTEAQRTSFRTYVNRIKPFGARIEVIATEGDTVQYDIDVEFDAQGDQVALNSLVVAAIDSYHKTLDFGGKVSLTKLVDAIQKIEGITDVRITSAYITPFGGAPAVISWQADTLAGYAVFDAANSNINYIPKVV